MDPLHLSIELSALLFTIGFIAGLVDAIAGGGGLIALPTLMFLGLPPQVALGTNKLQGCFGTFSASYNYIRKKQVSLKKARPGIFFTLIGATIGSCIVQALSPEILEPIIPILLFAVFIYLLLAKNIGNQRHQPRLTSTPFYMIFGISLGFYDGFFGPGTGSFWTVAFLFFMGMNMTESTGYTKIMNFTSNIIALSWFVIGGNVNYSIGLIMGSGQIIGARVGSSLAMRKGAALIKPILLSVVLATILRLMYASYIQ